MPAHTHILNVAVGLPVNTTDNSGIAFATEAQIYALDGTTSTLFGDSTSGHSTAFPIMPPFLVLDYLICTSLTGCGSVCTPCGCIAPFPGATCDPSLEIWVVDNSVTELKPVVTPIAIQGNVTLQNTTLVIFGAFPIRNRRHCLIDCYFFFPAGTQLSIDGCLSFGSNASLSAYLLSFNSTLIQDGVPLPVSVQPGCPQSNLSNIDLFFTIGNPPANCKPNGVTSRPTLTNLATLFAVFDSTDPNCGGSLSPSTPDSPQAVLGPTGLTNEMLTVAIVVPVVVLVVIAIILLGLFASPFRKRLLPGREFNEKTSELTTKPNSVEH